MHLTFFVLQLVYHGLDFAHCPIHDCVKLGRRGQGVDLKSPGFNWKARLRLRPFPVASSRGLTMAAGLKYPPGYSWVLNNGLFRYTHPPLGWGWQHFWSLLRRPIAAAWQYGQGQIYHNVSGMRVPDFSTLGFFKNCFLVKKKNFSKWMRMDLWRI